MFLSPDIDGPTRFAHVDRFLVAAALELVNAFAFTRRGPAFVFSAEDILEFLAAFAVQVAACFGESAFELVRNARYEADGSIGAAPDIIFNRLRMKR